MKIFFLLLDQSNGVSSIKFAIAKTRYLAILIFLRKYCFLVLYLLLPRLYAPECVRIDESIKFGRREFRKQAPLCTAGTSLYSLDPLAWRPLGPMASGSKLYKTEGLFGQSERMAWSMRGRSWVSLTLWYHLPGWPNKPAGFYIYFKITSNIVFSPPNSASNPTPH